MNLAEGESKGITSANLFFFFTSGCSEASGQKQIHLEILLFRPVLCYLEGVHEKPGDI